MKNILCEENGQKMFEVSHVLFSFSSAKTFLNLFLLFGTPILVGSTSSVPKNNDIAAETNRFRLRLISKLISFEKRVLPTYEGDAFLLHDEHSRAILFQGTLAFIEDSPIIDKYSWKNVGRGGGFGLMSLVPAGYNPFGYKITELGLHFLEFDGSSDSDVGRFLTSMRTRKRFDGIKSQWSEVLRISKKGQAMRIYQKLDELIGFCLKAGFLD